MKKNRYLQRIMAGICLAAAFVFLTAGRVEAKTYKEESNFGHASMGKAMAFGFGEQRAEITIQGQVGKEVSNGPDEAADDFYRFETPLNGLLHFYMDTPRADKQLDYEFLDAGGKVLSSAPGGMGVHYTLRTTTNSVWYLRLVAREYHNPEEYTIVVTYHPDKTTHPGTYDSQTNSAPYKMGSWEVYTNQETSSDYTSAERWYRVNFSQTGEYLLEFVCFPDVSSNMHFNVRFQDEKDTPLVYDIYDMNHEPVLWFSHESQMYETPSMVFSGNQRRGVYSEEDLKRIIPIKEAGTYYLIVPVYLAQSNPEREYQFRITRLSGDTEPETTKAQETTGVTETTKTPETTKAQGSTGTSGKTVVAKGKNFKVSGVTYKVTKEKKTVTYRKAKTDATSVKVPDTVKYKGYTYQVTAIHKSAFPKKTLKKLTIGKYVKEIPAGTFEEFAKLTEVTFAKSCVLKKIGADAFRASGLKKITIPASVTSIGDTAFMICNNLQSVVIGNKVTTIGLYAFAGCGKLTTVTIGSKVKTIGEGCFADDSRLKTITIRSKVLKTVKEDAFVRTKKYATVTVPAGKVSAYKKLLRKAGLATTAKVKVK